MALVTRQLSLRIEKKTVLNTVNLIFKPGNIYGILGPNGSGKTSLLKILAGIWLPTEGDVLWEGEKILQWPRKKLSQLITLVPQNPSVHFDFTAREIIAMGRYSHETFMRLDHRKIVENVLEQVDATHLADLKISELSGGERQRVYLGRALATEAPILLLDEPTTYLDLRHQWEIWQLLEKLAKEGKTLIVTLHDFGAARRYCHTLILLHQGHCVTAGSYQETMTPEILSSVFGLKQAFFESGFPAADSIHPMTG